MIERTCATCNYCRLDTPAESVALYGRSLGYGTCYHQNSGSCLSTMKAPAETTCEHWWSPLLRPSFLPDGTPNEIGDDHRPKEVQA